MQELKQIQEENRKAIIMACNPEAESYEEALKLELKKLSNNTSREYILNGDEVFFINYELNDPYDNLEYMSSVDHFEAQIITLNRVLIALNYSRTLQNITKSCYGILLERIIYYTEERNIDIICSWDLTKETLEEQSEEVQREINKLLNEV